MLRLGVYLMLLVFCVGEVQALQDVDDEGHEVLDHILVVAGNHPLKLLVNAARQRLHLLRHDDVGVIVRVVHGLALGHHIHLESLFWGCEHLKKRVTPLVVLI